MATDDNLDAAADVVAFPSPSGNAKVGLTEKAQALKDQWTSANSRGTIGPKKIVTTLCKYVEEVKRDNMKGVLTSYLVYMCPRGGGSAEIMEEGWRLKRIRATTTRTNTYCRAIYAAMNKPCLIVTGKHWQASKCS